MMVGLILLVSARAGIAQPMRNGFDLSPASIPASEILAGGPSRDGIPALEHPKTVPASRASWKERDLVLGVVLDGEARAYPIALLDWHELVNDTLGGRAILVSYCPLCGTGLVFDRRIEGETKRFGVSGLLYRSDLLMYDRETESLWSQIAARAVTGPLMGRRLQMIRSSFARWGEWKRRHPETTVLSRETGHRRSYDRSPYGSYARSRELMFPASFDRSFHPKMPTLGLRKPGEAARAYPASEIARAGGRVEERFLGEDVRVAYDPDRRVFEVDAPPDLEVVEGFWFAWSAFHPDSSVYRASDDAGGDAAGESERESE
ncbi:MAG: DUF3179 domain-containing protein [bacterium]